ncbi:primosomal protein N' [Lysobacter pythonis]|uniref:Replication restart protein PriA n=1 Tax=Solilutibacter pythonis TaxID=2483112 RepID=A0A3M2I2C8_9GAMM|nr:primosomal protein N' [Lysobacter pythonis]RMH93749.1 primosomal protein N' [Lysobacter pythonis]
MPDFPTLKVALPVPLPRLFDYAPPPGHRPGPGDVGRRLRVPFGARELVGMVAALGPGEGEAALREAIGFLDPGPLLTGELPRSLHWLAGYLHAPLGEVLATALPAALRRGDPLPETIAHAWRLSEAGRTALPALRAGRPKTLAEYLSRHAGAGLAETLLDDLHPGWRAPMRALEKRGLVVREADETADRARAAARPGPPLNPAQRAAADALIAAEGFAAFLLDGVTGSGKTEVYLEAIAACLARGRQALVLVPEIGLTPAMLARFQRRLGVPVHALHSGLNDGERARTWLAAARGAARVIVGTRSAVFVPLPEAGLVVVDEEHDGSYKQFDGIRYHARDFALVRAKRLDSPIVLGSATPSLESLHNAELGRYTRLRLDKRAGAAQPPTVRVIDVRKRPLRAGLSPEVVEAIRRALDAGGQVLVFRNRRGYAPVLLCHDCGWSAHCSRCSTPERSTPMTVHAHGRRLHCHHCGHRRAAPPACPDCASMALQPQGNGTERIEEYLADAFANVPVIRIDRGSTQGRDALQKHFDALGERPGILIGTQMLAKGHDLPNLTLVAVAGIDEGLYSADFRGGEKLAQLLIQVAGRAGRADRPGEVLLQTHHPEHPLLRTLIHGGYHAFAETEREARQAAGFPPFAHIAVLRAEAKHADSPMQLLRAAKSLLQAAIGASASSFPADGPVLALHGPLPAPHPRRAGYQRAQLVLLSPRRDELHRVLEAVVPQLYGLPEARKSRWSLDVDPVDLY